MLPNTADDTNRHNLRNRSDFDIPFSRLCSSQTRFFPSTLKLWNELNNEVRIANLFCSLKTGLRNNGLMCLIFFSLGTEKLISN